MRLLVKLASLSLTLLWGVCEAQSNNLSGSWHLNVDKSTWGTATRPQSVIVVIEHNEPNLQYRGTVTYANEDARDFGFSGAVDGKGYAMSRSYGEGTITLRRMDPWTIESVFKTEDGGSIETARTAISRDGKTLTRRLRLQSPEGVKTWTEIYERR